MLAAAVACNFACLHCLSSPRLSSVGSDKAIITAKKPEILSFNLGILLLSFKLGMINDNDSTLNLSCGYKWQQLASTFLLLFISGKNYKQSGTAHPRLCRAPLTACTSHLWPFKYLNLFKHLPIASIITNTYQAKGKYLYGTLEFLLLLLSMALSKCSLYS